MDKSVDFAGMAALLRAGFRVSLAGHAGILLAAVGTPGSSRWVTAVLWGYLVYLQVRVSLDAELFALLANGLTAAEMDGFLVRCGLLRQSRERSAADRCAGALRLWRRLLIVLAAELIAAVIGLR